MAAMMAQELEARQGFTYHVEEGVALLVLDLPGEPVNTLSPETGEVFASLLTRAEKDPAVKAVVFISGKKDNFVAGAKIDFLQTLKTASEATAVSRQGQQGFDRLDAFPKPVVAAIHGACLGGGLWKAGSKARKTPAGRRKGLMWRPWSRVEQ